MTDAALQVRKTQFSREKWPFYWLTRVTSRYLSALETRLKKIGLDVSRWRVLSCLAEDEHMSMSQLAELAIVKLPTIMKIVQRMEGDGLVKLQTRASDGRVTDVTLTEQGLRAREAALAIAQGVHDRCFEGISSLERDVLNQRLRTIFNALDH